MCHRPFSSLIRFLHTILCVQTCVFILEVFSTSLRSFSVCDSRISQSSFSLFTEEREEVKKKNWFRLVRVYCTQ